jgi:hypothetical protein
MRLLEWLYRLPGRINRSFANTAVASDVEGWGIGPQVNTIGVKIVSQEIETAVTNDDEPAPDADPPN